MTPRQNDLLLIGLLCLQSLIAAVVLANPADLGLSTTIVRWLVILQVPLTLLANQLKGLGAPGPGRSPLQQPFGTGGTPPPSPGIDPTLTSGSMPPPP